VVLEANRRFIFDRLMSCPNFNLVLNCAGSPKRFSSRDCRMESTISYRNWPENLIMTLFPMDGVVLKVRNQKERCHAWSLVATTSHVRIVSVLLFQDSTSTSTTLFVPSSGNTNWPCLVCLQLRSDTLLASCYCQAITLSHPFVPTILVIHLYRLVIHLYRLSSCLILSN
jgi:hypothetical protein